MPIAQLMPLPVHWPYHPAIERLSLALASACSWGWRGNGGGRKRDSVTISDPSAFPLVRFVAVPLLASLVRFPAS